MIKCNLPEGGHVYFATERVVSIGRNQDEELIVTFLTPKGKVSRRVITDFMLIKTGTKYD